MCSARQKATLDYTANKQPISRPVLSLQTLQIFHCVEQYFTMLRSVFCIPNMHQMWFASVTLHLINRYLSSLPLQFIFSAHYHITIFKSRSRRCRKCFTELWFTLCVSRMPPSMWSGLFVHHSLFYQPPFLCSHSLLYGGIHCALFTCKRALMTLYVCSLTAVVASSQALDMTKIRSITNAAHYPAP